MNAYEKRKEMYPHPPESKLFWVKGHKYYKNICL